MSARENLKGGDPATGAQQFIMTLLGPQGLRDKLQQSYCFMGRMRFLRPIEFTLKEADLDE